MSDNSVFICGLPESGKTTFLAALWHLVSSQELDTGLKFESLRHGDASHLNAITAKWRALVPQERTLPAAHRLVTMHLRATQPVLLSFPDLSGESFGQMWEIRECTAELESLARSAKGIVLLVQANTISKPLPLVDLVALQQAMGDEPSDEEPVNWSPRTSPTQVQVVDLLQLLGDPPLAPEPKPRKLAIVLSAWDKAAPEGLTPTVFLEAHLPLLAQFLGANTGFFEVKVFGVSAQGGDLTNPQDRKRLEAIDHPSERIVVVEGSTTSHDLTRIISWAMQ